MRLQAMLASTLQLFPNTQIHLTLNDLMRRLRKRFHEELRFLGWPEQHFADKALWRLGNDHLHNIRYVLWL